jgi:outer membrane protein TolC
MNTEIVKQEIYKVVDGVTTKVETKEIEVQVPTTEELVAEKEAQLLKMYEELKALKGE